MAIVLNNKVGVKIATVDVSDIVTAATLNYAFDEIEVTAGLTGVESLIGSGSDQVDEGVKVNVIAR